MQTIIYSVAHTCIHKRHIYYAHTQEKTIIFTYLYGFPCNANARYMARADTEMPVNVLLRLSVSIRLISCEHVLLFCGDLGGE